MDSVTFINNASISTDTLYQTAIDNLKNFINGVTDDSTDFQQTLNTFASAVATGEVLETTIDQNSVKIKGLTGTFSVSTTLFLTRSKLYFS